MDITAKIPGYNITYGEYAAYRMRQRGGGSTLWEKYRGANGETIDESNNGYTSEQINNGISVFATCTNCTIDISGTNAHRTAESNGDLNTVIANGNTITLNDTLGSELNVTASACSDPNSNEADDIGGFVSSGLDGTGANVFESQGAVKNTGSYALHTDANDTPTSGAKIELSLTLETATVYRMSFDWRHIGSGGGWSMQTIDTTSDYQVTDSVTSFIGSVYYFTSTIALTVFKFRETSGSNNGGIYLDNLSIKKVTFT